MTNFEVNVDEYIKEIKTGHLPISIAYEANKRSGSKPIWSQVSQLITAADVLDYLITNFVKEYKSGSRNNIAVDMAICWFHLRGSIDEDTDEYLPPKLRAILAEEGASIESLNDLEERFELLHAYVDEWFSASHTPLGYYGFPGPYMGIEFSKKDLGNTNEIHYSHFDLINIQNAERKEK